MAVVVTLPAAPTLPTQASLGQLRATIRDVAFDDSYPTGGEPLTAAQLGLTVVAFVIAEVASIADHTTGIVVKYDRANSKLVAYFAPANASDAALDEVGDEGDLTGYSVRVLALGI